MAIKLKARGSFKNAENFFDRMTHRDQYKVIGSIAEKGVEALSQATPRRTGTTAASWRYELKVTGDVVELAFINDNKTKGIPIVVLLRYGHGTRNGGYVKGRDFITPVTEPIFDEIAEKVWEEVTR